MLWYITYNGIECVILNYNFVLCAKSPELMGSLKYLNGLLRTIFEVITSFPSANIRTLSMNACSVCISIYFRHFHWIVHLPNPTYIFCSEIVS